ncbi:hypothetical protein AB0N05_17025 [Nocardia sp. NPDC051030]|uniref:hypothetical protein n=1 Tax=Nocardia sp. NPDC051030 TaxID=3155162 RepID=UPI0034272CF1
MPEPITDDDLTLVEVLEELEHYSVGGPWGAAELVHHAYLMKRYHELMAATRKAA